MTSHSMIRLRYLLRPREVAGKPHLQVLSVYRDHGVVPKDSRSDNYNKTPIDLARYQEVRVGDLVVNKMKAWQGSLALSGYHGIVSPDYLVCEVRGPVDGRFLHYLLRSAPYIAQVGQYSKGIRPAQWRIYWEDLADIGVSLPSRHEQRRIVDFLDAETRRIDVLVDGRRKTLGLLRERRSVLLHRAVVGAGADAHAPSNLTWAETLLNGWPVVRLALFARMGSGHTPSRSHPEWWVDSTVPWITTGEVSQIRDDRQEVISETRERISELGLANSAAELHPTGTVVLSRTASAGFSAVMGRDMATSQDYVTWTCGPRLEPFYLLWVLRAMRPDLLGRLAMGSTHKTIYVPDLQSLRIPLPPLDDQRRIVAEVRESNNRIDTLVDKVSRQLELLHERRQALTTAAVTGEIDVTTAGRAAEWAATGR